MRASLRLLLACSALAVAVPSSAQTSPALVAARQAGQVGERFDGYLGLVTAAPETIRRQVAAVNIRRRSLYISLAQRRNVTAEVVGIAAACEILRELRPGDAYMLKDGVWRRRAAGQAAPDPDYCG